MHLLTLDFGNTRAHAALFKNDELLASGEIGQVTDWLKSYRLTFGEVAGVISQVKAYDKELASLSEQGLLCERLKDYWRGEKFAGMPVHYAHTLGEDRLIQGWWAYKNLKTHTLIIDAGSFLTLDVVTPAGFQGGHILPGLAQMSTQLSQGAQLEASEFLAIEKNLLTSESLPHTTAEALSSCAIAYSALIQRLLIRWNITQVMISGGDAKKVQTWLTALSPNLPFQLRPDLVHFSLLDWYQRNIAR